MYPILGVSPALPALPDVITFDWKTGLPVNVDETKAQRHVRDPKFWGANGELVIKIKALLAGYRAIETKIGHVRDTDYWGMPYNTPITPGMKPKEKKPQVRVRVKPATSEPSQTSDMVTRFVKRVAAERERRASAIKARVATWSDDDKAKAVSLVEQVRAKGQPMVAAPESAALGILDHGIQSQFATATSKAGATYRGRAVVESALFDLPMAVDPTERPIYGYLSVDDPDVVAQISPLMSAGPTQASVAPYGAIRFRLKSTAKDRTTFSFGDTMDTHVFPAKLTGPLTKANMYALFSEWVFPSKPKRTVQRDYIEAQIHGGVDVSDIAEVFVPEGDKYDRIVQAAESKGIAVTRYTPPPPPPAIVRATSAIERRAIRVIHRAFQIASDEYDPENYNRKWLESKVRHVRDSAFWGAPVGTPLPLPERYRRTPNRPSRVRIRRRNQDQAKPAAAEVPLPGRAQGWTPSMQAYVRDHDDWSYGGRRPIRYNRYHVMEHTTPDGNTYYVGRVRDYWGNQYFYVRRGRITVERSTLAAAVRVANEDLLAPRGAGDPPRKPTTWWTAAMGRHFDAMKDDPRWSYGRVGSSNYVFGNGWGSSQDALIFTDGDDRYTITADTYGNGYTVKSGTRRRGEVSFQRALQIVERRLLPRIPVDHPPPPIENSMWTPVMDRWLNEHPDWHYERQTGGIPALCYGSGRDKVAITRNARYDYSYSVTTPTQPYGYNMYRFIDCTRVIHNPQFMDRAAAERREYEREQEERRRNRRAVRRRRPTSPPPTPPPHKVQKKPTDKPMEVIKERAKPVSDMDYYGYATVNLGSDDMVAWSTDRYTDEERQEIESALAEVRDQMKALAKEEITRAGIPGTVTARAYLTLGHTPQITVWIESHRSAGGETVELTRTFNLDGKSVYNASWVVSRNWQGHGLATKLTPRLEDLYRSWGMETVSVSANIDVGGFAWARLGFDFADEWERESFLHRMETQLDEQGTWGVETYGLDEAAMEAAKVDFTVLQRRCRNGKHKVTPGELASIGYREGATEWYGKRFMLETDWAGVKKL